MKKILKLILVHFVLLWSLCASAVECITLAAFEPGFNQKVLSAITAFDSRVPEKVTRPPFRGPMLRFYDFLLRGTFDGAPVASLGSIPKAIIAEVILSQVREKFDFHFLGPFRVGDSIVYAGRYGFLMVLGNRGQVNVGAANPVNGEMSRERVYQTNDILQFLENHATHIEAGRSMGETLMLKPLEVYLQEDLDSLGAG